MPTQPPPNVATGPFGALARPDWQPGAGLTATGLRLEQKYKEQRTRRHLRLVHGWGIVCGLTVVAAGEDWSLYICPGYGIGPCGDEIYVPTRHRFNLRDYVWTRPLVGNVSNAAWIALEAAEDGPGFRVVVSWTAPVFPRREFDICAGRTPGCPPCPETCGLVLASVTRPSDNQLLNQAITNTSFRSR